MAVSCTLYGPDGPLNPSPSRNLAAQAAIRGDPGHLQGSMRILFVNYEYPPLGGGGGVVMAALARALARKHEVTVLTSRALDLAAESDDEGVRVIRVPVFFRKHLAVANLPSMVMYLPSGLIRGLALAKQSRFDVINTHFVVPSGPLGDWLATRLHVPNILSVHGGDLFDPSKTMSPHRHGLMRSAVARLLRRASVVIGQSNDTVGHVASIYGVHREVGLIPLGIERPPSISGATRAEFGVRDDAFVMVTVGRVIPRKASTQLIEMLAKLNRPSAQLLILGDGPEIPAVLERAAALGVTHQVRHLGYVTDDTKYRVLSIADAFVSTSQHEGFGLVYLEAMAFGLPIVCYDRGGQTDFLSTPATGFVVKLNELETFTDAVRQLHDSPALCSTIRGYNLQRVEEFFIDHCANRYEQVFESALRTASGAGVPADSRR